MGTEGQGEDLETWERDSVQPSKESSKEGEENTEAGRDRDYSTVLSQPRRQSILPERCGCHCPLAPVSSPRPPTPSPPNKRQLNPGLFPSRSDNWPAVSRGGGGGRGERVEGRSGGKGGGQSPPRGAPWVDVPRAQAGRPGRPEAH